MTRGLISGVAGIAVIVALIVWLAWSSKNAETPAVVAQAPASSPATEPTTAPITSNTPDAARAEVRTETAPPPATAAPSAPSLESAEILLRGTVLDEHGKAVAAANLSWTDDRGLGNYAGVTDGTYSIPGLHAGHFLVQLRGWGWKTEQFDVDLPAQPPVQQRDFTARACTQIRIKLVDADGKPAIGDDGKSHPGNTARVVASKRPLAQVDATLRESIVYEADCGRFSNRWELRYERADIPPDLFGILEVRADPPLCVSLMLGNAVLDSRRLDEIPAELVFQQRPEDLEAALGGVRARLLRADGRTPVTQGYAMLQSDYSATTKTDAQGRVEFRGLSPGSYSLWLGDEGESGLRRSIVVEGKEVLDLGDVVLARASSVSLRFEFHAGSQSSVQYVLKPEVSGDPQGALGLNDNSVYSTGDRNPSGLPFPGPGSYVLRVTSVGEMHGRGNLHLSARPMRVVFTDQPPGEIVVPIESTTELCMRPPHEARGISRWLVSTADGLPCQRVRIEGRAPTRIELVPGEYTIARIDPETNALGKAQAFTVGSEFVTVDLKP